MSYLLYVDLGLLAAMALIGWGGALLEAAGKAPHPRTARAEDAED